MIRALLAGWQRGADHAIAFVERGEKYGLPWWLSVGVAWLLGYPAMCDLLSWLDRKGAGE